MNENRIIWSAFILSLLLHLVLAGIIMHTPALTVDSGLAQANEIEMLFVSDQDEDQPRRFVLLPERVANKQMPEEDTPKDLIAASLFNNRAADELEGGNESVASAKKLSDVEMVEIKKDEMSGADGAEVVNQPLPRVPKPSNNRSGGEPDALGEKQRGDDQDAAGQWALPGQDPPSGSDSEEAEQDSGEQAPQLDDWWGGEAPTLLKDGKQGPDGDHGFDFSQTESGSQGVGVAYVGNYSMNTYEWAFGPWIQKWVNQLHRHWKAPYAYSRLGMIHGKTLLRMVINKEGRMEAFEVVDREGHESLHEASEAAVKAFAPFAPLPPSFPKEHLVLLMELRYPALR